MPGITVIGSGHFVPGKPVTNHDLAKVMDTSDEWIKRRTGIEQRHFAEDDEGASDLGAKAAEVAIENAGIDKSDIDYIICATMTPDYIFPGSGGLIGKLLGIDGTPALDIRQQCAAMPFAFQVANGLVQSGAAETILVVGVEAHAGFMPWADWDILYGEREGDVDEELRARATRHRGTAIIFGDGAGALIMRKSEDDNGGLLGVEVHTSGADAQRIYMSAGGFRRRPFFHPDQFKNEEHYPRMDGRELFKTAVTKLPEVVRSLCAKHDVTLDDIDLFVPHQANDRINNAVGEALGLAPEKVASNIAKFGNTSGATIPILLDEVRRDGRAKRGDLLCFPALGAGLHWGAALMRL